MTPIAWILTALFATIVALYVVFVVLALLWWNKRYGDDKPTVGKRQW